jgi:hypothetical protein
VVKELAAKQETYNDPGSVDMDVLVAHMNPKITRNLDQKSDPLVDGVGRKIVLGGAHKIIVPRVLEHQVVPMLKGLDPLGEPGHCEVLP